LSTNLWQLSLNNCHITSLPPLMFHMRQLRNLFLSNNQITSIPPEIRNLRGKYNNPKLEMLMLDNNDLKTIPTEIGYLKLLSIFTINDNQITGLPSELAKLTSLTYWNYARNDECILLEENADKRCSDVTTFCVCDKCIDVYVPPG